jgi:multidrug resistance protein
MPPGYWTIWTTVALDLVGFGIVVPILGRYAERFGAGGLEVGLLFATFSAAQMLFAPVLGRLSDRIGRKPVIVLSLVGTAVGSVVTGLAGAMWVLFLGRFIDGASGASIAVAQGAVADIAPPDRRPQLLGMLGAAFGLGFVVGPALGGLAALGGPHVPFFVAGAIAAVNAVAALFRLPETRPQGHVTRQDAAHVRDMSPLLRRYAVVALMTTVGFAGFEATFSLFGAERFGLTEGSTSIVFLFVGLALVAVQGGLVGPLTARTGSGPLLRVGLVMVCAGLLALSFAESWALLIVAMVLLSAGSGVASPSLTNLVTEAAPPERRGETLGYQQSVGAFGRIIGPVIAGSIFDGVGAGAPYVLGSVLVALALAVVLAVRPVAGTRS